MVKVIKELTKNRAGGIRKYDWDAWMDGKAREFEPADWAGTTRETFLNNAYVAAYRKGFRCVSRRQANGNVQLQFFPKNGKHK